MCWTADRSTTAVIFGVATVPVVYAIGEALFSPSAGRWAAGLLAVTYFHVKYSQETRMYALMGLLFEGALWGLVAAVRRARPTGWVAYAACAALLLYSHGIAVVYVAVLASLFPLLAPRLDGWRVWRPWLLPISRWELSSCRGWRRRSTTCIG